MLENLPVQKGDLVRDERGVYGRVGRPVMVAHSEGRLLCWSVQVEYTTNGRWFGEFRILGPQELSVWRDGEWQELGPTVPEYTGPVEAIGPSKGDFASGISFERRILWEGEER